MWSHKTMGLCQLQADCAFELCDFVNLREESVQVWESMWKYIGQMHWYSHLWSIKHRLKSRYETLTFLDYWLTCCQDVIKGLKDVSRKEKCSSFVPVYDFDVSCSLLVQDSHIWHGQQPYIVFIMNLPIRKTENRGFTSHPTPKILSSYCTIFDQQWPGHMQWL